MSVSSQSDLERWIREQNDRKPKVHVSEPEYHSGGVFSKAYLDFLFTVTPVGGTPYTCRHRFSEVEEVRGKLKDIYLKFGIFVPATPSKGLMQNSADPNNTFVKERMRGLILFCDHVFSIPWLANDSTWLTFMGQPGASREGNVGFNMLTSALSFVEQPFKFTIVSRIASVKTEVDCVEAAMKAQVTALRAIQAADKNLKVSKTRTRCPSPRVWRVSHSAPHHALLKFFYICL
jgi:hypothetical protein